MTGQRQMTDPLVTEAEGLRADVRRLNLTVKALVWVVAVLALLVATLTALTVYLFVTRDDIRATLASSTATLASSTATLQSSSATLAILQGCLAPGPRTPTKDDPRTGNQCFDQLAANTASRVADTRLSIDCTALWELGQIRLALGLSIDPPAAGCDGVIGRIEALNHGP